MTIYYLYKEKCLLLQRLCTISHFYTKSETLFCKFMTCVFLFCFVPAPLYCFLYFCLGVWVYIDTIKWCVKLICLFFLKHFDFQSEPMKLTSASSWELWWTNTWNLLDSEVLLILIHTDDSAFFACRAI